MKLEPIHIQRLIATPHAKPEHGVVVHPEDYLQVHVDLQHLGLLEFHPNVDTPRGKWNTWTRTEAGNAAIQLLLKTLEGWVNGE